MAKLERWSLVGLGEAKPLAVRGEIHGDERFSDGTPITSSRLHYLDPAGHFACTKNHTYELGAISDAFARWMADNGRSLASYASALPAAPESTATKRARPTPIAASRPGQDASVTRPTPLPTGDATRVVQSSTLLVAAG